MQRSVLLFDRIKICLVIVSMLIGSLLFHGSVIAQTYNGYTLYSVGDSYKAYLVDMTGATYHSWTFAKSTCYSSYLLPGGVILRSVNRTGNFFTGGPISGQVQKVDWNGNVIWEWHAWDHQASHFLAYITTDNTYCPTGSDAMTTARVTLPGGFVSEATFFTVYPNPATNYITFELEDGIQPAKTRIQVISIDGKELLTVTLDGISKTELSLQGLSRGIYFIRVIREDRSGCVKIIKE